jgi:hypothetical protein
LKFIKGGHPQKQSLGVMILEWYTQEWEFFKGKMRKGGPPALAQYGFCGQEYMDIRRQLDQSGKATMIV